MAMGFALLPVIHSSSRVASKCIYLAVNSLSPLNASIPVRPPFSSFPFLSLSASFNLNHPIVSHSTQKCLTTLNEKREKVD